MTDKFYARYLYKKMALTGLNNPFKNLEQYFKGNFAVMHFIFENENNAINLKDIRDALGISGARITKIIQSLVSKGYVIKTVDTNDKRALNLKLTDEGKAYLTSEEERIIQLIEQVISDIGINEIREYLRISNKIKRGLSKRDV